MRKITTRAPRHLPVGEVVSRSQHLLVVVMAALLMIVVVVAGIGTAFALARKSVNLNLDGKTKTLYSWGATVADVLRENKISLDKQDKVEPGRAAALRNGMTIKIQSSREITVDLGGQEASTATTELSAAAAIKSNWPDKEVVFKATTGKDHHGNPLPLFAPGDKLQLIADGNAQEISALTGEDSVDILQRAKINVGEKDILTVKFSPQALPMIQIQRVAEEQVNLKESIPFQTETTQDDSMYQGDKTVTQKGKNGEKEIVKLVRFVDGQAQSETVQSEKILTQPVTQKVTVGTKDRPVTETAAISVGDDVWSKLAFCESGGRPSANTGNGFYGMYQFTLSTWRSVGGSGLPSDASAEEQTKRAKILQARSGWGQWPACTRKLGLR